MLTRAPGDGERWPRWEARVRVHDLIAARPRHTRLVVLGRRAAGCFRWRTVESHGRVPPDRVPPFAWHDAVSIVGSLIRSAAYLPHPSGRGRFWHDPAHRARAREFFAELAAGADHNP